MSDASRIIARIVGPSLIALAGTEAINMGIYAAQIAPVVYLNGTLTFVAGIAILQAHPVWKWDWRLLVTLSGLMLTAVGLFRMIWPEAHQASEGPAINGVFALLILAGAILTFQGYRPKPRAD
jgi:hypothetical protein